MNVFGMIPSSQGNSSACFFVPFSTLRDRYATLARPVSLRRPGGGICSPCSLCPRGARFPRGAARTALYEGGTTRLSRVHAPEVPHPAFRADGRAGAPARRVSLVRGAANQLSGVATLHYAPRAGTCGPVEPVSRTARHSWSLGLGQPGESRGGW